MSSETPLNPPTCVLPFDMFRTFSSISLTDVSPNFAAPGCEISDTETECVLAINIPPSVDTTTIKTEFKSGMLMVTLPKKGVRS